MAVRTFDEAILDSQEIRPAIAKRDAAVETPSHNEIIESVILVLEAQNG